MANSPRQPVESTRWVRGLLGDTVIVDSREQLLVWQAHGSVPSYIFRESDVATDLLRPAGNPGRARAPLDVAELFDIVLGERTIENGAWRPAGFDGYLGVTWQQGALDHWFEEDQEVFKHPHDPFVHIDAYPSSRLVRVSVDGDVVAESRHPTLLWETGLPTRYYLPRENVDFDRLTATDTSSTCPYKGFATEYWSVGEAIDVAWSYPEPFFPYRNIAGLVAFLGEKVDISVDGEPQGRPQ